MATEKKKKSEAKRKYHCACAPGDLSAVQPVTALPAGETTAKPVESKPSKPWAAVKPGAVERPRPRG